MIHAVAAILLTIFIGSVALTFYWIAKAPVKPERTAQHETDDPWDID